jgi:hypothetical protein
MKLPFFGKATCLLICTFAAGTQFALAQEDVIPSAKLLVIAREYTKPGKDGAPHQMVEGIYPKTLAANKINAHYYAAVSLSGPQRTLFFHGYSSFAEWSADQGGAPPNPTLDRANAADGDLLSAKDYSVWMKRDDLSLNPGFRVGTRLVEISQFVIKPGHYEEWQQMVKLVTDGYKKEFGSAGGVYLVITTHKSAAELDAAETEDKQFEQALGTDGLKKLSALEAACVESRQTNLFIIDPKMSYPPEAMLKADPTFWNSTK